MSTNDNTDNNDVKCKISNDVFSCPALQMAQSKGCSHSRSSTCRDSCLRCCSENDLLSCVKCGIKCCSDCVTRNMGASNASLTGTTNWCCFLCDSEPANGLQEAERIELSSNDATTTFVPERSETTVDISSPIVAVDDDTEHTTVESPLIKEDQGETMKRKECVEKEEPADLCQDLDLLLKAYGKQIQASLELADANVPAIISEINSIRSDQLGAAIHSYRKCLNAFASDLSNLEDRVLQAEDGRSSAVTFGKLTSLLRILVQHHVFNRICRPQARMRDDRDEMQRRQSFIPVRRVAQTVASCPTKSVVMVKIDPSKGQNVVLRRQATEGGGSKEVEEVISRIKDMCSKRRASEGGRGAESMDDHVDLVANDCIKRLRLPMEKAERKLRSLVAPGWMADFSVEKENEIPESENQETAFADCWTPRGSCGRYSGAVRRGRPPKYMVAPPGTFYYQGYGGDLRPRDSVVHRGRGRPRKSMFINSKEPRYYVRKKNGEELAMSQ